MEINNYIQKKHPELAVSGREMILPGFHCIHEIQC